MITCLPSSRSRSRPSTMNRTDYKPNDMLLCFSSADIVIFQALPDDLKMKLSLDEDLVSSPKEALSRASADRVAMRNKLLKRFHFLSILPVFCIIEF